MEGEDSGGGRADGGRARVEQFAIWCDARVKWRLRQGVTQRGEHWPLGVCERIAHPRDGGRVFRVQQCVGGREDDARVVAAEGIFEEGKGDIADCEDPLQVSGDALCELRQLSDGVVRISDRTLPLAPEEGQLLDVLFEDVRDESRGRRGHCANGRQLIWTAPPLIRFKRWAWETRSFPLIRILPSSRMVMEPAPTRRVRECFASSTSSSGFASG